MRGLDGLLRGQYPNGGWFVFYKNFSKPFTVQDYPVLKASYPVSWPRTPKGYATRPTICYILNDNLVPDVIRTMLDAWDIYKDARLLAAAKKGGDFLLLAQLPDPQPAWAQTYDARMQPVWGRKFEPPAIAGAESQTVLESLLMLYRRTADRKYLDAVPGALAYLKKSRLPDGRIARFYELQTNKPLYFTRDYELTYDSGDMPTHYKFIWESRLDAIEAEYQRLRATDPSRLSAQPPPAVRDLAAPVRAVLAGMDARGAWVERRPLRFHGVEPPSGAIRCETFANNVKTLCRFLAAGE
jgi:hypothetical protein